MADEIKLPDLSTPSPEEKGAKEEILRLGGEKVKLAQGYDEGVKKKAAELDALLSQEKPKPPEVPNYPAPPSQKIRPFAENTPGESWQVTMNKSIMSLGLLAQGVGGLATKYPEGALAAATGAMQGWHQGDKERGDREFKSWGAQVEQMRDKFEQDREHLRDVWESHQGDIESLKSKLAIEGIKLGASTGLIEAMQSNPEAILQWSDSNKKMATEQWKMWNELAAKWAIRNHQEATLAETKRLNDAKIEHMKKNEEQGDPGSMDPVALEQWAQAVSEGKPMPSLGLGKSKVRDYIVNRAGQLAAERETAGGMGLSESAVNYAAVKSGVANLVKLKANVSSFEQTAQKNLEIVREESKKVDRTGKPIVDRWLLAGKRATGDSEISAYDTAIRTASSEFARVVSTANASGVLSDSARHEIDAIMNPAMSDEQIEKAIGIMKRDMGNRISSMTSEIDALRKSVKQSPKAAPKEGAATHRYDPATGQLEAIK